jgi:hypothetical protein
MTILRRDADRHSDSRTPTTAMTPMVASINKACLPLAIDVLAQVVKKTADHFLFFTNRRSLRAPELEENADIEPN